MFSVFVSQTNTQNMAQHIEHLLDVLKVMSLNLGSMVPTAAMSDTLVKECFVFKQTQLITMKFLKPLDKDHKIKESVVCLVLPNLILWVYGQKKRDRLPFVIIAFLTPCYRVMVSSLACIM